MVKKLSGLQYDLFAKECQFICYLMSYYAEEKDSHSPDKKAAMTVCGLPFVLCLFTSKRGTTRAQRILVTVQISILYGRL